MTDEARELTDGQKILREAIQKLDREIRQKEQDVNDLAKAHIPDFHFLDYRVSRFWTCDDSPIGMCVFKREDINGHLRETECRYCNQPTERK